MREENQINGWHYETSFSSSDGAGKDSDHFTDKMSKNSEECLSEKVLKFYEALRIFTPNEYCELGLPDFRNQDFVEEVLDCWNSEKFREAVFEITRKTIDLDRLAEKRHQLLTMTYSRELLIKLHYFVLHTPYSKVWTIEIPESYFDANPLLVIALEIYFDPNASESRFFSDPDEIEQSVNASELTSTNFVVKFDFRIQGKHVNQFRFRAECEYDVNQLRKVLGQHYYKMIKVVDQYPDTLVDLFTSMSLKDLRNEMRCVPNSHVMIQTVAYADNYTGERNYELK
jgi:hypothetical protein